METTYYLEEFPQWSENRREYNSHGNIEMLLEKKCEIGKVMKFLEETGLLFGKNQINNQISNSLNLLQRI